MTKHRDIVPLGDMLDYCHRVAAKTAHISRAGFDADENLQLALTYLLQIIGEAASRVSDQACAEHPEIDWPRIVGMRNRIVHDYLHIDFDLVWDAATIHVPRLTGALEAFMPPDPP
jgi:uncharacterized protein with HEPN domain